MKTLPPQPRQIPNYLKQTFLEKRNKYCIGVFVLNEGQRIQKQLELMHRNKINELVDIIIIDGGSDDNSLPIDILNKYSVKSLLTKNDKGKLSSQLRIFFHYALQEDYEGFIIIDGNNKDGTEAIPNFVKALDDDWDYVQGSRYIVGGEEKNTPFIRKIAVKFLHAPLLSLASGFRYTDTTNGFRAISKKMIEHKELQIFRDIFDTYNLHYYLSLMAPKLGLRVKEIPVRRIYPSDGTVPSKIKGIRNNYHLLKILIKTIIGHYNPKW